MHWKLAAGLALAAALTACSTHRHDGTKVSATVEIDVRSTPEGARCMLERDGKEIAVVQAAPQTVSIDRGIPAIEVTCDMEGHVSTFETVKSRYVGGPVNTYTGSLLGALIVTGMVLGSPANYDYPSSVHVPMEPNVFHDDAAREARYANLRQQAASRHDARVVNARQQCAQNAELCRTAERESEKRRDAELARLEEFKSKAEIRPLNAPAEKAPAEKTSAAPAKKAG